MKITNICEKDEFRVQSCKNTCGNFTCECKDTLKTVIDRYEETKCYTSKFIFNSLLNIKFLLEYLFKGNQIRDFILYLYIKKNSVEVFAKNLKVSVESCNEFSSNYSSIKEFKIKLNSFHETLIQIKDQFWHPVYIDNMDWSSIEFVCKIQLKILMLSNNHHKLKDFEYVNIFLNQLK